MSRRIVFRRAARNEFDDAANWYEQRQAGRGEKFTAAVRATLGQMSTQPELSPEVFEDTREARVRRYPSCVYYPLEEGQVVVIAVFHTSRDPSVWQARSGRAAGPSAPRLPDEPTGFAGCRGISARV